MNDVRGVGDGRTREETRVVVRELFGEAGLVEVFVFGEEGGLVGFGFGGGGGGGGRGGGGRGTRGLGVGFGLGVGLGLGLGLRLR